MTEEQKKEQNHEDRGEVLGNLVKVVVLIWSASLLTFSYVRLPNGQKILDFDPTFIASVFSGSLAAFGLSPSKSGGNGGATNSGGSLPETPIYSRPKEEEKSEPEVQPIWDEPIPEPQVSDEEKPRRGDL